ncbi:hypothetical protein AB0D08_22170 [Kitasatospora sp. NPDC048540]|uniref:hypothetical protein n=1 Tax=Kitasatospora sp. NPDC048540 TaxID=3155634 RepID=UPI0033D22093
MGWLWDGGYHWLPDSGGPFVETEGWADRQMATLRAAGYEPTTRDEDDYLDDYRTVFGDAGDEAWYLERGRGAILISDNGCGMTGWLIIVGPHRGELRDRDCATNPKFTTPERRAAAVRVGGGGVGGCRIAVGVFRRGMAVYFYGFGLSSRGFLVSVGQTFGQWVASRVAFLACCCWSRACLGVGRAGVGWVVGITCDVGRMACGGRVLR